MLTINKIKEVFKSLNAELSKIGVQGEIGLCGGAVMCLVFQTRKATKDVDAIFEPAQEIRKAAKKVAKKFGLDNDWLNDAAKGYFLSDPPKQHVMELSHLRIWAPQADYMLAMKCISARYDTYDKEDVVFLIKHLNLKTTQAVFEIISKYYPHHKIPAKTQFFIEELLG